MRFTNLFLNKASLSRPLFSFLIILLLLTGLSACNKDPFIRQYREDTAKAPHSMGLAGPGKKNQTGLSAEDADEAKVDITWVVPKGWRELPSSPFKLASFENIQDPTAFQVSISILGGQGGGLLSNLDRWMSQLGLNPPKDPLMEWVSNSPRSQVDGWEVQEFDFTPWNPKRENFLIYFGQARDHIVVVKMSSSVAGIAKHKPKLTELLNSMKRKANP